MFYKKGEDYKEIKKVIAINILDYNEFEDGPYHEIAKLRREYLYKILTDKIEIHFIQIPKFKKQRKDMKTKLDMWMDFISQIDEKEVKNAMSKNKEIKKAQEEYEYLTGDEEERRIAFLREKAIRDENSIFDAGKDIGKKEGIEIGKEQTQKEIVKTMTKEKMPIETIMKVTKLSREEIEKIQKNVI